MCHKVIEEIDAGEVLAVKSFSISPYDSLEDVSNKMKIIEKDVLIDGLQILMRQLREKDK